MLSESDYDYTIIDDDDYYYNDYYVNDKFPALTIPHPSQEALR